MDKALDIRTYIRSVQQQRLALKALMSAKAHQLLKNQHNFTLLDYKDMSNSEETQLSHEDETNDLAGEQRFI